GRRGKRISGSPGQGILWSEVCDGRFLEAVRRAGDRRKVPATTISGRDTEKRRFLNKPQRCAGGKSSDQVYSGTSGDGEVAPFEVGARRAPFSPKFAAAPGFRALRTGWTRLALRRGRVRGRESLANSARASADGRRNPRDGGPRRGGFDLSARRRSGAWAPQTLECARDRRTDLTFGRFGDGAGGTASRAG